MKTMKNNIFIMILIAFILLSGCRNKTVSHNKKDKEELKSITVMIEKTAKRELNEYIRISGKLEGFIDIVMLSETNGRIIKLNKNLGDWVNKGEQIGYVDNEDYRIRVEQAKASVLAAEASFEASNIQMETGEELFKNKSISEMEYQNYISASKNAKAILDGAKASLKMVQRDYDNSRFIAPVSGNIVNLPVKVGETVNKGKMICGIVNSKKLLIKTGVGESEIYRIKKGQSVDIFYDDLDEKFEGKIIGLGIKPLPNSVSYPIEIQLNNKDGKLYSGMVIEGRILSKTYENVIYTSLNNIIEEYDQYYVFVINDENKAEKIKVQLGTKVEGNMIITEGINVNQKLVIEGLENLEEGTEVKIR